MKPVIVRSFQTNWTAGTSTGASVRTAETQVNPLSLISKETLVAALEKPEVPEAKKQEIRAYLKSTVNGHEIGTGLAAREVSELEKLARYDDFFKPEPEASVAEIKKPKPDPKTEKIYLGSVTPENSRILLKQAQELFTKEFLAIAKQDRGSLSDNGISRIQNCVKVIFALVYLDFIRYRDQVRTGIVDQEIETDKLSVEDLGSFDTAIELVKVSFAEDADMQKTVNDMCVNNPDINNLLQRMTDISTVHTDTQREYKFFLDFMRAEPANLRSTFNALYVAKDSDSALGDSVESGNGKKRKAAKKK